MRLLVPHEGQPRAPLQFGTRPVHLKPLCLHPDTLIGLFSLLRPISVNQCLSACLLSSCPRSSAHNSRVHASSAFIIPRVNETSRVHRGPFVRSFVWCCWGSLFVKWSHWLFSFNKQALGSLVMLAATLSDKADGGAMRQPLFRSQTVCGQQSGHCLLVCREQTWGTVTSWHGQCKAEPKRKSTRLSPLS